MLVTLIGGIERRKNSCRMTGTVFVLGRVALEGADPCKSYMDEESGLLRLAWAKFPCLEKPFKDDNSPLISSYSTYLDAMLPYSSLPGDR